MANNYTEYSQMQYYTPLVVYVYVNLIWNVYLMHVIIMGFIINKLLYGIECFDSSLRWFNSASWHSAEKQPFLRAIPFKYIEEGRGDPKISEKRLDAILMTRRYTFGD